MKAEKIIYDRNDEAFGIAVFDTSGLAERDIYNDRRAIEGNVYLGKIVKNPCSLCIVYVFPVIYPFAIHSPEVAIHTAHQAGACTLL